MYNYFKELEDQTKAIYSIAEEARAKGLDPLSRVEILRATSLAERAVNLVSTKYPQLKDEKITKHIKNLEKEHGFLDPAIALTIAEEIAKEKFCKFKDLLEAIDAGVRTGFAYFTLGVVSSPLEGYTYFKLKKTKDDRDFFSVYYSGPIRSAGGTAAAFSLIIIDHLREIFGFAKYDPTKEEIKRAYTELLDYHELITNLQYLPSKKETEFLFSRLPIQINGEPSEEREVSNYKDLPRIETNNIRSGFCLVLGEGIAQKAPKILKIISRLRKKGFKLSDWNFLEEFVKLQREIVKKKKEKATAIYIQDIVAGRPVLAHPSRSGGFRLRYGRTRASGYSSLAIHPATMYLLDNSIAIGTQLKLEKPTKATAITCCDSIDGPIVKLDDDSVVFIKNLEEAKKFRKKVKEILYLGDILIPYGDFLNRNYPLQPQGYTEQYWYSELKSKDPKIKLNPFEISLEEAKFLSKKYGICLHPKYTFFWSQIETEKFFKFLEWLKIANFQKTITLPYSSKEKEKFSEAKRVLELLGIEHKVTIENVVIEKQEAKALISNLGLDELDEKKIKEKLSNLNLNPKKNTLELVNKISNYKIKDKAGTFIGARMGRPEKAKLRKLTGSPNVLFPVGQEGGRLRSIQEAMNVGFVKADFPIYYCEKCKRHTIYFICETCGNKTTKLYYCNQCSRILSKQICEKHGLIQEFNNRKIDIKHYYNSALKNLSLSKEEVPELIKGVRGTSSKDHTPENLSKGILRAIFNLQVNKDGTIRYDATELPITHFKPKEIGTSIEKLKKLGYKRDIQGRPLENENQILEIKPHDVILPSCPFSLDEPADKVLIRIANFIDNLLVRFYGLKPFYNIKTKEDLIGHLVICIAPHNAAGVLGRIIGFSKVQALFASPYMHAAMRRDCDGDEASFILLLDALLNFSRKFLPSHRGSTQDSPLVINVRIRPGEVDDMVFDMEVVKEFPLELYEKAEKYAYPDEINIEQIKNRLDNELMSLKDLWFSYDIDDINNAPLCSSYKTLTTMQEKVMKQMELARKIRAVDETDVARLVIERHFIRDIKGNLRKFSQQQFRCVQCNEKYRRPPLSGKCLKCQGKIILTVSEGSIIKYLEPALNLAQNYNVPEYTKQCLHLIKQYIESIFGKEKEKQETLSGFLK